jgi:hypothetical protein
LKPHGARFLNLTQHVFAGRIQLLNADQKLFEPEDRETTAAFLTSVDARLITGTYINVNAGIAISGFYRLRPDLLCILLIFIFLIYT